MEARGDGQERAALSLSRVRAGALVAALLGVGHALQLYFLARYPQPILFGDPAGYYGVGQRLLEAAARIRAGEPLAPVFESVRGLFYLIGVGSLFGVLEAWRPGDFASFRMVMAAFNTLTMLGVFLLGRRLAGTFSGGLIALALATVYPAFSVQTGRLYPDPVTGCLFVFSAWLFAEAVHRRSPRVMALAALALSAALVVRAQVLTYFLLIIVLGLAVSAPSWARLAVGRRLVAALVAGLVPAVLAWGLIVWSVGKRDDVIQLGNATFRPYYPYGFWQFLETDGWIGPYRFKQEPFYLAMEAEARERDPELLRSRARQWRFVARYVAARPADSVLLVLDNAYRLYDRPANDYKWDFPFAYRHQVTLQRVVLVLGVAGLALFVCESPALAGVFLVPIALAVLHGLVFPWPRYNLPAMPILIASAGALIARTGVTWRRPPSRPRRLLLLTAMAAVALLVAERALFLHAPEGARIASWAGGMCVLVLPFAAVTGPLGGSRRHLVLGGATFLAVALLFSAHALRDRRWHEHELRLGEDVAAIEQRIHLTPESLERLRTAEAFVVFDLTAPHGDLVGGSLEIGGRAVPIDLLRPTMPRLREATAAGGRDRRTYPQWWAIRIDPAWLPPTPAEPLRVRLTVPAGREVTLRADRFAGQDRVYEGPSLGDWPHYVALKIEYDGDYRIPVTRALGSARTESLLVGQDGATRAAPFVHRVRILAPGSNQAWMDWETAPVPAGAVALGWFAYSGTRGDAELLVDGAALRFPLGSTTDFDVGGEAWRLCHRAEAPRQDRAYGAYVLLGRARAPGRPLALRARYQAGLSQDPMFYVIDRRRAAADLAAAHRACDPSATLVDGAARIVDGSHNNYPEDTGRWTAAALY